MQSSLFISLYLACFHMQVSQLRQWFFNSIYPGGLAGDRLGVVPASGFSFSAQQIWKVIKENEDLDVPAYKVYILASFIYIWTLKMNNILSMHVILFLLFRWWLTLSVVKRLLMKNSDSWHVMRYPFPFINIQSLEFL